MLIKTNVFAARRAALVETFGGHEWLRFENRLRAVDPKLHAALLRPGPVDVDVHVGFEVAWLEHFYAGDPRGWTQHGAEAARFALTAGPYRHLLAGARSSTGLARILARLWRVHVSEGRLELWPRRDGFALTIHDASCWHLCIEAVTVGYVRATIELARGRSWTARAAGPDRDHSSEFASVDGGGDRCHCHYDLRPTTPATATARPAAATRSAARSAR